MMVTNIRYYLFVIVILLFVSNISEATVQLVQYNRVGPNTAIACAVCRFKYSVAIREDNTTVPSDFTSVYGSTPGVTISSTFVGGISSTEYQAILLVVLEFPSSVPQVQLIEFIVESQGVNSTIQINDSLTCISYAKKPVVVKQTQMYRLSSQTAGFGFQLSQDLSIVTQPYYQYPNNRCFSSNLAYTCTIMQQRRGDHDLYIVAISTSLINLNETYNYSAPITTNVMLDFSGCTSFNYSFTVDSLMPMVQTITTKFNSISMSNNIPYNYSLTGEYPISVISFNVSNLNTILSTLNGYPLLPVLGNKAEAIYLFMVEYDSYISTPFFHINGNASLIYRSDTYFTKYPSPSFYINTEQYYYGVTSNLIIFEIYFDMKEYYQIQKITFSDAPIPQASIPQAPYGYSKFANQTENLWFQITFPTFNNPNLASMYLEVYDIYQTFNYFSVANYPSPAPPDSLPPTLEYIDMSVNLDTIYIVARISDDVSGLNYINVEIQNSNGGNYYLYRGKSSRYLVEGDKMNGTYVFICTLDMLKLVPDTYVALYLYDEVGNTREYLSWSVETGLILPPITIDKVYTYEAWNFTYFQIIPNNIDTSNGPVNVSMVFNLTTINLDYEPHLMISMDDYLFEGHVSSVDAYGRWDYTDSLYRIDFQVPARMPNDSLIYTIDTFSFWGCPFLVGYGFDADLKVWSSYMDSMPPVVEYLSSYSNSQGVGYNMTVVDQPNGLKEGFVSIISNIDLKPYVFQFNSTYLVSGDIYRGTYSFNIPLNLTYLMSQTFYIVEMELVDNSGIKSIYPIRKVGSLINPLYNIMYSQSINITVSSPNLFIDDVKPTISDFTIQPQTIDIGSLNRTVTFTLTVRDDDSGISSRHDPKIYLTEFSGEILVVDSLFKSATIPFVTYTYQTILPIMFGYENITVSVYGIVDNQLNMNGYSANQLKNISMPYMITTTATYNQPIITNSSRVYQHGGTVTLYGFGFGNKTNSELFIVVDYLDGRGNFILPISKAMYTFAIFELGLVLGPAVNVKLQRPGKASNVYTITKTNYYNTILKPQPISCPSQCNGHGNCTVNGCVCNDPWSGPDCSSKPIIIPTPATNTTDPVIIIDTGGGGNTTGSSSSSITSGGSSSTGGNNGGGSSFEFRTIIAIHSIRELSISGDKVKEYFPSNWTFTNQTNNLTTTDGSISKYHYSTQLNNTSTLFNVTIQYFINQSTIQFAGQPITLSPYSTKMSLDLTSYPFQSTLNTLQIIFNVEFISKRGGECLDKQFGLGNGNDLNDLQWMKLNIDDKSLYGNFIRRGVVDGRYLAIKNSLLDSQFIGNGDESQSFIGINVPQYQSSVYLDPDFSHILEVDGDSQSSKCSQPSSNSSNSKTGMIAGIVVGAAVFAAIVITSIMFYKKRRIMKRQSKQMDARLKKLNQLNKLNN